MKQLNKLLTTILAGSLMLPVWAGVQTVQQEKTIELTPQEISAGAYRHTGDLSLTNQPGTSEDIISAAKKQVSKKGGKYYKITRLQMMNNSSWSINVAMYAPTEKIVN